MRRWIKDGKGEWVEVEPENRPDENSYRRRKRALPFLHWRPPRSGAGAS